MMKYGKTVAQELTSTNKTEQSRSINGLLPPFLLPSLLRGWWWWRRKRRREGGRRREGEFDGKEQ